jgi:hypothetical protein
MSRPKPRVILEYTDPNTNQTDQILEADAIWAVYYRNEPINLKNISSNNSYKYKKTSFSNEGHAHNLAKKLNTTFNCSDFAVLKLSKGVIVR